MSNIPAKDVATRARRSHNGMSRLVRMAGAADRHEHMCAIYSGSSDLLRNCIGLARHGVVAGLKNLLIFDGVTARAIGAPLGQALARQFTLTAADELFEFNTAPISIATIIRKLEELGNGAVAEGYNGLFVLHDMSWMLEAPSGLANHGELEAALHELVDTAPVSIACLYNRLVFPANMLLDALRTHSEVYENGQVRTNPHFLPPTVFLSGDPQQKVDWWLTTLHDCPPADGEIASAGKRRGPQAAAPVQPERPAQTRPRAVPARPFAVFAGRRAGGGKDEAEGLKRWKIRCLGDVRIYSHDGRQIEWNRGSGATFKTKTLFAYLFQKGPAGASVEETADLLWPEASDLNQSLNRLYHTVHCLRMALSPELTSSRDSPYVVSRNRRYSLVLPEGTWIDVPVFEQFCRQGEKLLQAGDLDQSLVCHLAAERLYTGSLFEDIPVEYIEDPERDWCWSKRFWLEEIHLKMLTNLATIYRQRNDLKLALHYCERVLKADPCLENAHREAMRVYHLIGRRDALERQFRMCRESLKRFEDRPPSTETTALARELMK